MATRKDKRISANGVVAALHILGAHLMNQRAKAAGEEDEPVTALLSINDKGHIKASNVPGIVFAITHSWLAEHDPEAADCDNSDEAHEHEYSQMLKMVEAIFEMEALHPEPDDED